MNPLMIHVERIVRPIRASQSRKLRMRQELLAHLETALKDEKKNSTDEGMATERALARLGDPIELTRQLQRTVPLLERLLLAKIPMSARFDEMELKGAARLYGPGILTLTFSHISVLAACAGLLAGVPWYINPSVMGTLNGSRPSLAYPTQFFVGMLISLNLSVLIAQRLVFQAAETCEFPNRRRIVTKAGILLFIQVTWAGLANLAAVKQLPTLSNIIEILAVSITLLLVSFWIARLVANRRQRFQPWLELNLNPQREAP